MHEPNITKTLRFFETTEKNMIEWQFREKQLFCCPEFFASIGEKPLEQQVGLRFFWRRLHPDDRFAVASSLRQLSLQSNSLHLEFRLAAQGNYIWFRARGKLFTDDQDQLEYLTVSLTSTNEEKMILERLRLSEERLDLASRFAEICLWEVNADYSTPEPTRSLWWSDSFYSIFEYSPEEIQHTQEHAFKLIHPEDLQTMLENTQIMGDSSCSSIDIEIRIKHKTKGYLWQRCLGYRERISGSQFRGLGAVVNINDLKLAQREAKTKNLELKRSNDELEHFAYAASHDLKAPLRGLKSLAEWISEDIHNPSESISQNLMLMKKRVTRMENMLADILAYSRAGWHQNELEEIQLKRFIEEIWECLHPPKGFKLKLQLGHPSIKAPKTLLEQTFSNLISNAIKHHDNPPGNIIISYQPDDQYHQFSVCDDGPGIDPRFEEKIFRIFQTLHPRDTVEGSGVGLAIVKKNVESLGGRVWLEPVSPDKNEDQQKGSCFRFTLPFDRGRMSGEWKTFELFDNGT